MNYKRYWIALTSLSWLVRDPGGRGPQNDQRSAAPPRCLLNRRPATVYGQHHHRRSGGMAVHRRPGDRHCWGHGAYVAPDWSADWLHRESVILLDRWAQRDGAANFAALDVDRQAVLQGASDSRNAHQHLRCSAPIGSPSTATARPPSGNLRLLYRRIFNGRAEYAIPAELSQTRPNSSNWPPSSGGHPGPQAPNAPAST